MDPRSRLIFSAAQTYFQLDRIKLNELENERHVVSFLDCLNIFTLACYLGKDGSLLFFNEILHRDNTNQMLVFVKLQPTYINEENYKSSVMVCSIPGSPVLSFYNFISKLFAPLLLKGDDKSILQDPKIQIALTNLAAGLSAAVSKGDGSENTTSIFTLMDEVNYWRNQSRCCSNNNIDEMKQCELFASLLEGPAKECNRIESSSQSALDSKIDSLGLSTHCSNSTQKQPSFGVFLTDLIDILDSLLIDTLDELWRCTDSRVTQPYPEHRMRQLIESLSYWTIRMIQSFLGSVHTLSEKTKISISSLWILPFDEVKQAIQLSIEACERWIKSTDLLTQQLWPRYTPHPWNGPLPNLAYLIQFKNRLNEILNLRGLYEQLYYFTTPIEHNQFKMDSGLHNIIFNTLEFDNIKEDIISPILKQFINPLAYNPYTIEQWQSVIQLIDTRLQPIEECATNRFRTKILSLSNRVDSSGITYSSRIVSNQILMEFRKFQYLIHRPIAAKILQSERELLLGYLEVSLKEYHEEFLAKSSTANSNWHCQQEQSQKRPLKIIAKNISDCINQMLWGGQLKSRIQEELTLVKFLLSDLQGFSAYEQEALSLIEQIEDWHNEQFQAWSRDRLSSLSTTKESNHSSLAFDPNGPLLNLSTVDGHLEVGFPDGLVQLQREVRLLSGLGYPIPYKLIEATNQAEKISQYAVMLRQVAHFYNSIDSEMLPFQKPLMLNSALAFERLIKSYNCKHNGTKENLLNTMTWNQTEEIQPYIQQLQKATKQLIMENRRLRKVHYMIIERIIKLLDIDLLRNQSKWRNELNEMRYQLSEIATNGGYPADHMAPWRAFLDHQLYKVLEYQYRKGLEEISERIPEMRVDMVYIQSCLAFRPPFEEIKAKYYRELKKFICIPNNFRGFNEFIPSVDDNYSRDSTTTTTSTSNTNKHIFSYIIDNQESGLRICYKKAEFLFTRLFGSLEQFQDWVILGSLNLDDFVDLHCRDLEDYERNFKALKIRGRDAEKLPNEIRIDCIIVNCIPVKTAIDGLLQNLFDTLQNCLRRSIHGDLVAADGFLTDSLDKLSNRPQTIDELITAKSQYNEYSKTIHNLNDQIQCAERKNQLLCTVSGNGVTTINTIKTKWEKFNVMMESFQFMMNEQLEILKSSIINETKVYFNNLERFKSRWNQLKPGKNILDSNNNESCLSAVTIIKEYETEFHELELMHQKLIREYEYLDMPKPDFSLVNELANDLNDYSLMWLEYDNFSKELQNYAKEDWISFKSRYYVFEEFLTEWSNKLRSTQPTPMTVRLQKEIDGYMDLIPVLKWLKGDHLTREHWYELFRLIGLSKEIKLENLLFGDFFPIIPNIIHQSDTLKSLSQRAQAEIVVREALQELDLWGSGTTFTLTEYIDSSGQIVYLVKDWKEIVSQVGDNLALLASLQDSPYIDNFLDRSNAWVQRLTDLDYCLTRFQLVQRKWVYLEPIMSRGALPKETARYAQIDEEFRKLIGYLKVDNRVISLVSGMKGKALKDTLNNLQEQLARCQRALNEYLEEKRNRFSRFYFLGDDDLLEILSQSTNSNIIQSHLKKLFQGIHTVQFKDHHQHHHPNNEHLKMDQNKLSTTIVAIGSFEGEVIHLNNSIQLTNEIECCLEKLTNEMKVTLNKLLIQCLNEHSIENQYKNKFNLNIYPEQILILSELINFCKNVENALNCGELNKLKKDLQSQLAMYTTAKQQKNMKTIEHCTNSQESNIHDSTLSRLQSCKLSSLILDTIHSIDIIDQLIQNGAVTPKDWLWQRQLRFYMNNNENSMYNYTTKIENDNNNSMKTTICMADAEFLYTFEYQGNSPRLVHTPLTDKCYLTLTQAMRMGLGGNPYGPAGTGKTESVKALGSMMGRQVLVFNCDEGIDLRSMTRIFVGIVKCGAWGCFDEFNRLEESVLSAISMQIQIIQDALKSGTPQINLLGRTTNVDPNSGLFITLNPIAKGYGGRQKLPDNLKQLFRPVSMTKPDIDLIAEMILFSEGFSNAQTLSRKLVSVFSLAKQLLSVQQHYDWGLRALKTVLHCAGTLLHTDKQNYGSNELNDHNERQYEQRSYEYEAQFLIQAIKTNTLAKLTNSDAKQFENLIRDVFPDLSLHNVQFKNQELTKLIDSMHSVVKEHNMILVGAQIQKAIELYEQLSQRMGVVLVGPCGSGKSTVLNILRLALNKMGISIRSHIFNPKSMLRVQLLGQIEADTREWTDGVLTHSARCVVKECIDQKCWIISDGDIDPEWIESLNSVLDDNHLLTLPSGERIQFDTNVNFLFETHELIHASPATISRMGVVYNEFVVDTSPAAIIFTGLSHLVGAITPALFTVGLIRGLGANLTESARNELAIKVYEATGENPPDITRPLDVQVDPNNPNRLISYSTETSVAILGKSIPHYTGFNSRYSEIPLNICIEDPIIANAIADSLASGRSPLVLTPDVRRSIDAFRCWLSNPLSKQSFLLVGPEGCGKTLLLDYCFTTISQSINVVTIQCSAQTTPNHILDKLMQYCICIISTTSKMSSGRILRPKEGDQLILYLRDLNLPKPDKWGSCQLIAFLQQILTYQGYYDPTSLEFISIEGIQFVGSFTPSTTSIGLGHYSLSKRFTSALRLTVINYPDKDQLVNIYACLLQATIVSKLQANNQSFGSKQLSHDNGMKHSTHKTIINPARIHYMSTIMIQLLSELQHNFRADEYAHCVFTPHLLTQWVTGLLRYDLNISVNYIWAVFGYEAKRLFRDCLPGENARHQFDVLFNKILCNCLNELSNEKCNEVQITLKLATEDFELIENEERIKQFDNDDDDLKNAMCWFVTWSGKHQLPPGSPMPLHGRPLGSITYTQMKETVLKGLKQLAREKSPQAENLVLFPDFIDYICRIDRVLSRPSGSLLLAGRSGIGRRSALNIVAHIHQLNVFRLHTGRDYQMRQFITDMKTVCQAAGIENQPTLLIIEDYQLKSDYFLEIINSLLACGEASGLISADELETLMSSVASKNGVNFKEQAAEAGHRGPLTAFFAERIHKNLHFAIILDIDDYELFSNWLQSNPSFYKYCSVQWMDCWSKFSLLQIPKLLIPKSCIPNNTNSFIQACVNIHNSAPYPHMMMPTPRHFISLCTNYTRVEQNHRQKLQSEVKRLKSGLIKLTEARERVTQLKKHAVEQGELLVEKQTEADKALEQISAAIQGAAEQRSEMEKLQSRTTDESTRLERRKLEIDAELNEIEPLVHQARSAVGNIKSEALSEIRALRAPPDIIRDILEGVLLLMGIRDTSWVSMRGFLAKRGVQEEILNFDARKITPDLRLSVEELLAKNQESFEPRVAKRASVAAAPLATWVRANVQYAKVLERIAPLEKEHAKLKQSLIQAENSLTNLTKGLSNVDSNVANLRTIFEKRTSEAANLKMELEKTRETLLSAETLVGELESEHTRWENQINEITIQLASLPPLALIASAFITYLSACPEDVRRQQITNWIKDLTNLGIMTTSLSSEINNDRTSSQDFDLRRFLSTEHEQLLWYSQGLPSDQLSGENAVTIVHTTMCPFIIDPSSRALNWLKVYLKDQRLEVVNQQSPNFITTLELAVRFGKCLIVQEVDEIEPILMPLLLKDLIMQGSRNFIRIGEKLIDYHQDFRLFLCTRKLLYSLDYIQPISANPLVTIINFITTQTGLIEQLLEITLQNEYPQLEIQRQQLIHNEEEMKMELAKLENDLLEELSNAHGNILENKELLSSLNKTKQSSLVVTNSLEESLRLQAELNKERNVFYPLAETSSRLYFALKDLMKINHMYQFSLNSFLYLYQCALSMTHNTGLKTTERIQSLQKHVEQLVYENVCRALFKPDRLMFALHMVRTMRPQSLTDEEWLFFIGLNVIESCHTNENHYNWLDTERARNLMKLKAALPNIYNNLCFEDSQFWTNWLHENDVEMKPMPKNLQSKSLTAFHFTVLAVQALRPDRLYSAMSQFASRTLDLPQLSPLTLNLHKLFETETRSTEPILILISPGADPSQELSEAAALHFSRKLFNKTSETTSTHYRQIAMGQGQTDLALKELHLAAKQGDWLCMKNLHLVIHWLPVLEKEINTLLLNSNKKSSISPSNDGDKNDNCTTNKSIDTEQCVHEDFRLWLTAEPRTTFPSTLLQGCLKIAYEAPPGLKRNLQRTYETWPRNYISQGNSKTRATLLACLAWFHAIVQERRTYIPQGWTKFYEFTFADLRAAADVIDRLLLKDHSQISRTTEDIWSWIYGLFGESIYGGRMDNTVDLNVLNSYLTSIFNDDTVRNRQLGPFKLPGTTELKDYIIQINTLPDHDLPIYFNLSSNIENSIQRNEANRVITQLRLLNRPLMDIKHKFDKNLWSKELGPILILWKKLNQGLNLLQSRTSNKTNKSAVSKSGDDVSFENKSTTESPIREFLHLELYNALQLIQHVHSSLASIARACKGTQLVTGLMHQLAKSLLHGETPDSWLLQWPEGPNEVVPFLRELVVKSNAVQTWTKQVENNQFSNEQNVQCLDLANLFHPATFLNALRQQSARRLNVPIDTLKLSCQWLEPNDRRSISSSNNQSLPIRITNLKLEGANFRNGQLSQSCQNDPSLIQLPDILLKWIQKDEQDPLNESNSIYLPIYTNNTREHLVTFIRVPCPSGSQNRWIQAGTALLLNCL
uniref:Cytoplasmic dynein 2 heavy chain 1 n=1 Tax=Schistosoma mansoni TaxID=6183 RepID=A0A5K4FDN9_SCHMA